LIESRQRLSSRLREIDRALLYPFFGSSSMSLQSKNIVFVHGLFGWGPSDGMSRVLPYWGEALAQFDGGAFATHEAKVGPVSSFHDRACELYAQIRGRRVDYGEKHSQEAGHARFSPTLNFEGKALVPDWSAKNPVILVGHSAGAQTVLTLQRLLREGLWNEPGDETGADWVEAIVCVAGVLNGSLLTYVFGCDKSDGQLHHGLPAQAISSLITLAGLAKKDLDFVPSLVDLWLDHWPGGAGASGSMDWFQASDFVKGTDNLAYDLSLQGCRDANDAFEADANTYYLSLVTGATQAPRLLTGLRNTLERLVGRAPGPSVLPESSMISLLKPSACFQAGVTFDGAPIPGWGVGDLTLDAWAENDGAVSSISERYPFTGRNPPAFGRGFMSGQALEPGRWNFERVEDVVGLRFDHIDPVCGAGVKSGSYPAAHRQLWSKLRGRLSTL
jgi:triacylglycerol lipase